MTVRELRQQVPAQKAQEGAGVTIHRTIGTPALRHLDPFLLLDHFGSDNPNDYSAGFPDHPHRGFITLTYMLDGHLLHQDSMGSRGELRAGGIQWMKAASGVIHSEMPQQERGLMRGFQLWINLPARAKMSDPEYQEFAADKIPQVAQDGAQVKVISGRYGTARGPVDDPYTGVVYLDVALAPASRFAHSLDTGANACIYVFEGALQVAGRTAPAHHLLVFGPGEGDRIEVSSAAEGARFILLAGQPLAEPIVQYGPFVMNSQEEIIAAIHDYQQGRLVRKKATLNAG
jgi:hypothetical protein